MLTHVVFFKLNERNDETVGDLCRILESMEGKIPQLQALEVGADIIGSERSYDIVLISRFESLEAMQAYQVHPYHQDVVLAHVRGVAADVKAIDYLS